MEPRDVFDGTMVFLIAVVVYVEVFGFGLSRDRLETVLAVLLGLDYTIYLVLAAVLGVAFLGYITIYVPQKYGEEPVDRPR